MSKSKLAANTRVYNITKVSKLVKENKDYKVREGACRKKLLAVH